MAGLSGPASVADAPRPLVEMTDIDKSFPGVRALSKARFQLLPGEVHALMGENGAGKSTLMKILSGVYTRDAGSVLLDGQPVEITSPRQAQDLGIGIIHQELALMRDLTAAQNIFIGREPRRFGILDEGQLNRDTAAIFASMNLKLEPTVKVETLTIAKQQMVEIAKALSYRSRVLIMDEPTAALNDAEIAELFTIINRLKAEGVGVVYISHKMDEIKRISDRVTIMRWRICRHRSRRRYINRNHYLDDGRPQAHQRGFGDPEHLRRTRGSGGKKPQSWPRNP